MTKTSDPDVNQFKKDVKEIWGVDLPISGGMGGSLEDAIIINTSNSGDGVLLEYQILNFLFIFMGKKWKVERQEAIAKGGYQS